MARGELKDVLWEVQGDLLFKVARDAGGGGLEVAVYDPDDNVATLYAARTGGGTLASPISSSAATGEYDCFLDPGSYRVEFSRDGVVVDERWVQIVDAEKARVTNEAPLNAKWPEYGAVGDGTTDDTAAFQAIDTALPAVGGHVYVPPGDYVCSGLLNFDNSRSVRIEGAAGMSAGAQPATRLKFTGTGSGSFISARDSYGFGIADMAIVNTSGSFTGNLIDVRGNAVDTQLVSLDRVYVGGLGSSARTAIGLNVDRTASGTVRDCNFSGCNIGVKGKNANSGHANVWLFERTQFYLSTTIHARNAAVGWTFLACTFEQRADGTAGAYDHDTNVAGNLVSFLGCYFGDASASGTWITYCGTGLNVTNGNIFGGGATGIVVDDYASSSQGVVIKGNEFTQITTGISLGANITKYDVGPNVYDTVTNPYLFNGAAATENDWHGAGAANLYTANSIETASHARVGAGGSFKGVLGTATTTPKVETSVAGDSVARYTLQADGTIVRGAGAVAGTVKFLIGAGTPEGAITAGIGSIYQRTDGGAGTSMYVKESGTGSTGWIAK